MSQCLASVKQWRLFALTAVVAVELLLFLTNDTRRLNANIYNSNGSCNGRIILPSHQPNNQCKLSYSIPAKIN